MTKWNSYSIEEQRKLRNLQIAREDQWREDMLVKFQNTPTDHCTPVQDTIEEHSVWFSGVVEAYMNQLVDSSRERSRMPEWMHQVWNLGPGS